MNIGEIKFADCANGPGMRVSVFVSGCRNKCKGCFQPETWDFNFGKKYTQEYENLIIEELSMPYYSGLTILGGEPLEPENRETVLQLIKKVRSRLLGKTIWVYTGKIYEDLTAENDKALHDIFASIDVLVDGPFVEDKKNILLKFRGSDNQRILKLKG